MRIALWLRAGWFVSLGFALGGCGTESRVDAPAVQGTAQALTAADCPSGYNLIQGTNAAETLTGTAGNDCIIGLGGNDTISGGGGNDYIAGGNGDDIINGEAGNDQLFGEGGGDNISGGDGNDTIDGGAVADTINCGAGDDTVLGGAGDDIINGDAGRDLLNGGDAVDTIHGGTGDDVIHGDGGNDLLYGDDDDDVIDGDANADSLFGGNGDDVLYGDLANDDLHGDAGDDALIGGAGTNTSDGGAGTDACTGTSCEKAVLTPSGCTQNAQCSAAQHCIADFGLCIGCVSNQDNDALCDSKDGCPTDASKSVPGQCGCGVSDADGDSDGTANCNDGCPSDATKIAAGVCGCGVSDADGDGDGTKDCNDGCPSDASKIAAGVCGCGVSDADGDGDGTANCNDGCPSDATKVAPGVCGCGVSDADSDSDGTANCSDGCPSDAGKVAPGICGCGVSDTDGDGDGTPNCNDGCVSDASKVAPGVCGCGVSDADSDSDGTANCNDGCVSDASKVAPGVCGCGVSDADSDSDGTANCHDGCPSDALKVAAGVCGCGVSDADGDGDGTANCHDGCVSDASKTAPGVCGCGVSDADSDNDGTANCNDGCVSDAAKTAPGVCGCGVSDADGDNDGTANCNDGCPSDASKTAPGACGCGTSDADSDDDGVANCNDVCPGYPDGDDGDGDGIPTGCDPEVTCTANSAGSAVRSGDVTIDGPEDIAGLAGIQCITGNLTVEAGPLTNLEGLESLVAIAGSLYVSQTDLESVDGLDGLTSVGGDFVISQDEQLVSLGGLEQLTFIGGAGQSWIWGNTQMPGCWVWEIERNTGRHLNFNGNRGTSSCGELPMGFECVPGAVGPGVIDGDWIIGVDVELYAPDMHEIGELGGVTCITGDTTVMPFYGFEGADLVLSHLVAIGGHLTIDATNQVDLSMLSNLSEIGNGLTIADNDELVSLSGLSNLTELGAHAEPGALLLSVRGNSCLPETEIQDLEQRTSAQCGAGGMAGDACVGNDQPFLCGVVCLEGDFDSDGVCDYEDVCPGADDHADADGDGVCDAYDACEGDDLADTDGDGVTYCYDTCPGFDDADDSDGDGIPNGCDPEFSCTASAHGPTVREGDVSIYELPSIEGLAGIQCITGDLRIYTYSMSDLDGLQGLVSVAGSVRIVYTTLTSLHGLEGLEHIGGDLHVTDNYQLTSLAALSDLVSIDGAAGESYIGYNEQLPGCWVWEVERQTGRQLNMNGNRGTGACGELPRDFECVPGAVGPGVLEGDHDLGTYELGEIGGVTCITGDVSVQPFTEFAIADAALAHLVAIGGHLTVQGTPQRNLSLFQNLREVGRGVAVVSNLGLTSLSGLGSLTDAGAHAEPGDVLLSVQSNPCLPQQEIDELALRLSVSCGEGAGPEEECVSNDDQPYCESIGCYDPSGYDNDGDGVTDLCDACQFVPDSDQDNLCDDVDACPFDDGNDSDHDGVCGDVDLCWNGDDHQDEDADGVPDACDTCPGDTGNDSDFDGICAAEDTCPGGLDTLDADGDGFCDALDQCPGLDDADDADGNGLPDCVIFGAANAVGPTNIDSMATADLDGDGDVDLVVGTPAGQLQQWLGDGAGGFTLLQSQTLAAHGTGRLSIGDANGDGYADVVVGPGTWGDMTARILIGDGNGHMTLWRSGLAAATGYPVRFGDITGDGAPDLVYGDGNGLYAWLGSNNPANAYQQRITISENVWPQYNGIRSVNDFELGNFDGDAALEIFVLASWSYGIFYVDYTGSSFAVTPFTAPNSYVGQIYRGLAIGDFDGDGANDVAIRRNGAMALYLRRPVTNIDPSFTLQAGAVTFVRVDDFPLTDYTDLWTMASADVTGSPAAELLFTTESQLWVATAEEQGAGNWQWRIAQHISLGGHYEATSGVVAGADVDSDGLPDLIYAKGAWTIVAGAYANLNAVYVQLQSVAACLPGTHPLDADCDGVPDGEDRCPGSDDTLDADQNGEPDPCPPDVDADDDGVLDAEDMCPGTDDTLDVNPYDGEPDGCTIFTQGPNTSAGPDGVFRFAVGDVDGNGSADVMASATDASPTSHLWLNDGAGALVQQTVAGWETTAGAHPLLHDMDADGNLDAVIGLFEGGAVFYGDGSGAFPTSETFPDLFDDIQIADVTGDGTADVVLYTRAPYAGTGGVVVWVGAESPARGFVDRIEVRAPDELAQGPGLLVRTGDLDGDGTAEIVVRSAPTELVVYRQTVAGFVGENLPLPSGVTMVEDLAFGHHNGDARADLVTLESYDGSPTAAVLYDSVTVGTAPGSLDMQSEHFALKRMGAGYAFGATRVLLADVTGSADGELVIGWDYQIVVATIEASHEMRVLQRIDTVGYTIDLHVADLEQDGDTDLFYSRGFNPVTQTYDPVLGVLLNQSP